MKRKEKKTGHRLTHQNLNLYKHKQHLCYFSCEDIRHNFHSPHIQIDQMSEAKKKIKITSIKTDFKIHRLLYNGHLNQHL